MDASETKRNDWSELDVTKEELDNINECLKKEEFRKLFIQYASEVTDPENRKIYQREIIQLEKERGIDVKFVNSQPGYVIKTSLNGDRKCFINIGKSEIIDKPTSQPSYESGNRGLQWSIPFTLSPPHDDLDKKNIRCTVFDVVFHPDTIYLASKNPRFRDIVNNTALDGIENNFKVKLDRKNIKFPKLQSKGVNNSTVIRKKCEKPPEKLIDVEPEIYQKLMSSYDEAREKHTCKFTDKKKPLRPSPVTKYYDVKSKLSNTNDNDGNDKRKFKYTTPKFVVKHQTNLDIQDFKNTKDAKLYAAIPKNLVVVIDLPLLKSSTEAELDVQERLLIVSSEKSAKYYLELPLPYRVDPDNGNAKFDSLKKKLTITLPVIRDNINKQYEVKDDSGVESDHGAPPLQSNHELINGISNLEIDSNFTSELLSPVISKNNEINPSNSLISEIKTFNDDNNVCNNDTTLRTMNSSTIYDDAFMNDNIIYSLPNYTSRIYENILTLIIHIKNVDSGSIKYKLLENNSGIHITLSSVGAGFFPIYYSLCLKIGNDTFESNTITVEPWDNNVVFTVGLKNIEELNQYKVGLNEDFMENKDLPNKITMENSLQSVGDYNSKNNDLESDDNKCKTKIEVLKNNNAKLTMNVRSNNIDSDDEDFDGDYEMEKNREVNKHENQEFRSVSESSGDELSNSNGSNGSITTRGILKYRRNNFSRSVSESSIDDTAGLMSSVDLNYDSVHDLNSESECSSLKKTVRFNDVVSRQLFRSNSSILGRRKKNQRKLRKKKQAHERRMSESENSENEEREKYKVNVTKNMNEEKLANDIKPILNRDRIINQQSENNVNNQKTEFKNDLIFDLDV